MPSYPFQSKLLRPKTSPEEYRVYRAGLEWDLTDPIIIEKREDLKSEKTWRGLVEPYHHQVANLITFCRRLPVTLLADDVGLGKTISAGLVISELISRARVEKVLVVCPKLLGPQWKEELLAKFNISAEIAIGKDLITAEPESTGAIITTYHSARAHLESIPQDRFQMLVLDEAHKLRNLYGTEEPPQVAKRFRKALEDRRFRFVIMLTATPIQNRLWDLYSLVDLLTVARGHQNPFGSEGMFARKFIADGRDQARHLKAEARDEFRSIVYGYMSRVRRGDAKLYFPERVVQMHKVDPTNAELNLISAIAEPIQKLNRLAQISILQALASSPEALLAQLTNMARNGTVPSELATTVRHIVIGMPTSAKLLGLGNLIDRLKKENPDRWRLVVFTTRLETQTTIQAFLEARDLKVGIINGSSGSRNQDTIARFRRIPPAIHVIASTEAGSEGVNLQVANVLVNYDLPWNPMIVEQRIGRIQRLASEHKSVGIFNIMLRGTFEEYIVGRLMEKLQMASHAIGDIEALLEASGIDDEDGDGVGGFDEQIRRLVVAALAGKDFEQATRQTEHSIAEAKRQLEREEQNINEMLGSMDGTEYSGPRAPTLPSVVRSLEPREFTLLALKSIGARLTPLSSTLYLVEQDGAREHIRFPDDPTNDKKASLYTPGSAAFQRLVGRIIATGVHEVEDIDHNPSQGSEDVCQQWVITFGGTPKRINAERVWRCFTGKALVRVRATVAHDSYERLCEVPCAPQEHTQEGGPGWLKTFSPLIEKPDELGIQVDKLVDAASADAAITEFYRFYLERRALEVQAAGFDERKRKKLEDDFTPRLQMTLVALEGKVHRRVVIRGYYTIDGEREYESLLTVEPSNARLLDAPELAVCARSGKNVPKSCLKVCQISGAMVMEHLLVKSEISQRSALPEFIVPCSLSGKRVLKDEVEASAVTGRWVCSSLLKTSALSAKRGEPEYFGKCEFTNAELLKTELGISEVSGKLYRTDERVSSAVSGVAGHKDEFIVCHVTNHSLTKTEAEQCEVTGNFVRPGVLESCAITGKRVLPSEIEQCAITGKRVLRKLLVTSSVSTARFLEDAAIRSATGKFCTPIEAGTCTWSGRQSHPDDLRVCSLTGLPIRFQYADSANNRPRLKPLLDLLDGIKRNTDEAPLWEHVTGKAADAIGRGRCKTEAAILSPDKRHLAACLQVRTLLGFRVHWAGAIYSIPDRSIVGRISQGKRTPQGWSETGP